MRVAVIGAGSWGTTVAALTSTNAPTVLWAREPQLAERLSRDHRNAEYLPDIELPEALEATASLEAACTGADVVVMGVPSHGFRTVLEDARSSIANDAAVISLSKGLEQGTVLRMTEVIAEVLPDHRPDRIGVLTGPNLAREVAPGPADRDGRRARRRGARAGAAGAVHDADVPGLHEPRRRGL